MTSLQVKVISKYQRFLLRIPLGARIGPVRAQRFANSRALEHTRKDPKTGMLVKYRIFKITKPKGRSSWYSKSENGYGISYFYVFYLRRGNIRSASHKFRHIWSSGFFGQHIWSSVPWYITMVMTHLPGIGHE